MLTVRVLPVCRELIEVQHEDTKLAFKVDGLVTNANYSMKKSVSLLFINRKCSLENSSVLSLCFCLCVCLSVSVSPSVSLCPCPCVSLSLSLSLSLSPPPPFFPLLGVNETSIFFFFFFFFFAPPTPNVSDSMSYSTHGQIIA